MFYHYYSRQLNKLFNVFELLYNIFHIHLPVHVYNFTEYVIIMIYLNSYD